jgi:peroxiredoxin Q/BCP
MSVTKGKKAPSFSAKNQKNEVVSLKDYTGKKLVLFFYPKDSTPGCTAEACDLRDNYARFIKAGYALLGVSPDSVKRHINFINKYHLPFDLLSDEDHAVSLAYGVWKEKSMFGIKYMGIVRTTFVINEKGVVEDIIEKVDTKDHTAQLLA